MKLAVLLFLLAAAALALFLLRSEERIEPELEQDWGWER